MNIKRVLATIVWLCVATQAGAVGVGQAAPAFVLPTKDGTVDLSTLRGKVVYVDFWASWCGPCKQSFPWLSDMQAKYGDQGLVVVGINVDHKRSDADRFLASTPAKFTVAFDAQGTTPTAYRVTGMPSSYLVGRNGQIVATHVGFRQSEASALEATLRAALGLR